MTLREAAQQALESMDDHMYRADTHEFYEAKEALRAALRKPERQPLTLWQVEQLVATIPDDTPIYEARIWFARLIEQAHGIKGGSNQ